MRLTSIRVCLLAMTTTVLASSCAQLWPTPRQPNLGVQASGEELWIRTQEHQAQVTSKEKVGEAVHKDSTGKNIGTTEVYEDRVHTVQWTTWYPMQGGLQLDDEDFLRIAGDETELEKTREYRESGIAMNKWGKRTMIAGAVALVGSFFIPADMFMLRYSASTAGTLAAAGGWYMAWAGAGRFEPDSHVVEPNKAAYLVHEYNASLQRTDSSPSASLSVGGEF